jgi:hypothetical protein
MSACPILNRYSFVRRAVAGAPMSDRILIGTRAPKARPASSGID